VLSLLRTGFVPVSCTLKLYLFIFFLINGRAPTTFSNTKTQTVSNPNAVRVKIWLDSSGCHGISFAVNQCCRRQCSRQITFAIHKMARSHRTLCSYTGYVFATTRRCLEYAWKTVGTSATRPQAAAKLSSTWSKMGSGVLP
jgi:hypothetical protein